MIFDKCAVCGNAIDFETTKERVTLSLKCGLGKVKREYVLCGSCAEEAMVSFVSKDVFKHER